MSVIGGLHKRNRFLATAVATPVEQTIVIGIAGPLAFVAAMAVVRMPLVRTPCTIPGDEVAPVLIDVVTAALLHEQAMRLRSAAALVFASGYLSDALIIGLTGRRPAAGDCG